MARAPRWSRGYDTTVVCDSTPGFGCRETCLWVVGCIKRYCWHRECRSVTRTRVSHVNEPPSSQDRVLLQLLYIYSLKSLRRSFRAYQHCIMHGALFTTPLPLLLIAPSDRECSICLEPYIEPSQRAFAQEGQEGEWAVRVELVAEVCGLRRCCGHVMGKQCLEAHLRSSGPWKRRCPLCREVWFQETSLSAEEGRHTSELYAQRVGQAVASSRHSPSNNARLDRSRNPRNESSQSHTLVRPSAQSPASFTQRVREKLEIKEGSDEVGKSLEEVEQVLGDFFFRSPVADQ